MVDLVLGANTALSGHAPCIHVTLQGQQQIGEQLGLVWLALDAQRKPTGTPAYLQSPTDWASVEAIEHGAAWQLQLSQVPPNSQHLMLVLYSYSSKTTLGQVECKLHCTTDDIHYTPPLRSSTDSAMIVLEVYQRNGQWKLRALAEGSPYGLAALGRRLELALDEKHPTANHTPPDRQGQGGTGRGGYGNDDDKPNDWTGTAFAISPRHLLTCAHVADEARQIQLSSLQGRRTAQCIAMDRPNDVAVLLINEQDLPHVLPVHQGRAGELGESVTALGYPLSGLIGSHLQVTQGCISSLRGYQEDIGRLQFTAPIQSGSSGSPLLDQQGQVLGMVTSSLMNAQNMNFAVKHYLIWALLDTIGFESQAMAQQPIGMSPLSQTQLVKQAQKAIWQVSCQR
ncbi:MAG: trypsin-like peptidase domain-containing protein [Pseudomonadota bacterium]|nr:trypsin-like peptidase domain-containing protein [Pseudomonadota bacterium]